MERLCHSVAGEQGTQDGCLALMHCGRQQTRTQPNRFKSGERNQLNLLFQAAASSNWLSPLVTICQMVPVF